MSEDSFIAATVYDPVSYWNQRTQPNTEENPGIKTAHRDFFCKNIPDNTRILEVGPGIGRLFPLYEKARDSTISTIDLSPQHRSRLNEVGAAHGLQVNQFVIETPIEKYPFIDGYFDVVVSSYVLIHVPFDIIEQSLSELARVAKKVIVCASSQDFWPKSKAELDDSSHVFSHDYISICEKLGFSVCVYKIIEDESGDKTYLFTYWR